MDFVQENVGDDFFTNQLLLSVDLGLPYALKVVCRSSSRNNTSFEIFDQLGDSMGWRNFSSHGFEGPALGQFARSLIDDLNVLLEEFCVQLNFPNFLLIARLAFGKCESRYGNGVYDGDCIIILQKGVIHWKNSVNYLTRAILMDGPFLCPNSLFYLSKY